MSDHPLLDPVIPAPPEREVHTLSPEARRQEALHHRNRIRTQVVSKVGPGTKVFEVAKRVAIGTYNDGFIHAGNLAYMAILAIFPFFITGAAIFSIIGDEGERAASVNAVLYALPPVVGNVIEPVARSVVEARSGWLLWLGGLVGLWTVSQPDRDDPRHPAPRLRHPGDAGVLEIPAVVRRGDRRRGGAADAQPARASGDRRRAGGDRRLFPAAVRRDRRAARSAAWSPRSGCSARSTCCSTR